MSLTLWRRSFPEIVMASEPVGRKEIIRPVEQHIICVDDDPDFLKSLEFFLPEQINRGIPSNLWYNFLFLDNPLDALDIFRELTANRETVAMVISDQKMPRMKGTEFLAETKNVSKDTVRVLLTGYAGLESAITAINKHLLDKYLTKPIENEHDFTLSIQHLLQRFQMQRTIAEQNRAIHDLYGFSNVLNTIEDFQKTLDYIVSFTKDALRCERISIMLIQEDELHINAAKGLPEDIIHSTRIPIGERVSGEVFRSRKAILAKSLDEVPYLDGTVQSNAQSFISIPILYAGLASAEHPLGVINVTNKVDDLPFSETDLETLTYIANTASIAIHNQLNRIRLQKAYSETRAQAATLEYQMKHDALTDLPNRTMLHDCLQQALLDEGREKRPLALLILDLDRFKEVNDTLGHHNGDILLQHIGERLRGVLTEPNLVARLGGDEFAVLLPVAGIEDATIVSNKILETIKQPVMLNGLTLEVSASIGVALYPDHGEDPNLLIQRADVAMFMAKEAGDSCRIYDSRLDPYDSRRLMIMSELRHAIENNQLILHYQPKIDLQGGCISGVEALVRWQHPQYDLIPPDQFILVAEQTGLIKPLTLWVLNEALRQCSAWRQEGLEISVAVNLSARNLQDTQLHDQISCLLETWKVPPGLLELEITESSIMANPELAKETLTRLNAMGIRLAIDDFGTGHSSLAYIKNLPVNEIKIDKSFVKSMAVANNDVLIVQATIELGHNLGLTVIAEGVENREIYNQLINLGCDSAQGYFMNRPVPAAEFMDWLGKSPWGIRKS